MDEPPFGKDIVNLQKKYGTVSGYKMYPYGRFGKEDFKEDEHPRDKGGKFTRKGRKDSILQQQIDYFESHMEEESQDYIAFQKVTDEDRAIRWKNKKIKEEIKKLKEEMDEPDLSGLPELKQKPNTHKPQELDGRIQILTNNKDKPIEYDQLSGFKAGSNTHINADIDIGREYDNTTKKDLYRQMNTIKLMWNDLPDETRDSVKMFTIQRLPEVKTEVEGMKITVLNAQDAGTLGYWSPAKKDFVIRIDGSIPDKQLKSTVTHESAHVDWHRIKDEKPERIAQWEINTKGLTPPTPYAKTNKKRWDDSKKFYIEQEKIGWKSDLNYSYIDHTRKEKRDIVKRNTKILEDRYYNELHSEVHMYMMGHTKTKTKTGKMTKSMEKFANAYKELHEL